MDQMHSGTPEKTAPEAGVATPEADLVTHIGFRFHVRPARKEDEAALTEFFRNVTADDLRFRFLAAVPKVEPAHVAALIGVDHRQTEHFLAFDPKDQTLIASAMLAATPDMERAEVAISIRADYKHRGIGWTLLDYVAGQAKARGIKVLESLENRENREAINLEREMGFTAEPVPGDSTVVLLRRRL